MRVSIDMRGVSDAFRRAPGVFMAEMSRGAKEGLVDIQRDARRNHRFKSRSGNLSRAVQVDFKSFKEPGKGMRIDTGLAPYGGFVHEGTRPHKIAPKNKAALSFIGKNGQHYFVKSFINHPGTKPDRFLYEAAERGKQGLVNKIIRAIGVAIVKLGLRGK